MSAHKWYYVCDSCGDLTARDSQIPQPCYDWKCSECGSSAAWEFPRHREALEHSRHIQSGVNSGLFRKVSA